MPSFLQRVLRWLLGESHRLNADGSPGGRDTERLGRSVLRNGRDRHARSRGSEDAEDARAERGGVPADLPQGDAGFGKGPEPVRQPLVRPSRPHPPDDRPAHPADRPGDGDARIHHAGATDRDSPGRRRDGAGAPVPERDRARSRRAGRGRRAGRARRAGADQGPETRRGRRAEAATGRGRRAASCQRHHLSGPRGLPAVERPTEQPRRPDRRRPAPFEHAGRRGPVAWPDDPEAPLAGLP